MALSRLSRKGSFVQSFRNNRQLQQFVLTDVTPTGRILGTGSYGSVEEVTYQHRTFAGKKLHEILLDIENENVAEIVGKYQQECQLMSSLHHPNITQFLGLCFLPGTQLPLLVMERLESSLDDLLEHMSNLPFTLKRSVLEDVASGLLYLHNRQPSVIHRDLTAKNVLLTSSLVAKITDMGNSRIIDMRPGQLAKTLSKLPGTLVYMPPEALDDRHRYGPFLDIFSFGHLALFTLIQTFPGDLLPGTYPNPDNIREVRGRTELERRGKYIDVLEAEFGRLYSPLVELVKQCLHNVPDERPHIDELLITLQSMKEGDCGSSPINLDMVRVKLAKEIKMKDRRIEELTQEQNADLEEKTWELEDKQRELGDKTRELEVRNQWVEELQAECQTKDQQISIKQQNIQQLESQLEEKEGQLQHQEQAQAGQLEDLRTELRLRETQLVEELQSKDAEICRLREELRKYQGLLQEGTWQVFPLQLRWRRGPDIPFWMSGYAQSVLIQGTVYVAVGGAGWVSDKNYIVMAYDTSSRKWAKLPPYSAYNFTLAVLNDQLLLVGGYHAGNISKSVGVWKSKTKEWAQSFPEMLTSRYDCSAVAYKELLLVTGGLTPEGVTASVEVLNTESKQWYAGPPTLIPLVGMKTAVVGDMCYFMGGETRSGNTTVYTSSVYSISFPALVSHLNITDTSDSQIWKEIPGLELNRSTPLSIGVSLFAVGGTDTDYRATSTIHLYQPETAKWVKVGDLPAPRYRCACTMINKELLVAGGWDDRDRVMARVDMASIKQQTP